MIPESQDRAELITEEYKDAHPYPPHHYYQSKPHYCAVFGCGVELNLQERLAGAYCYSHQGHAVIEKVTTAMLMRLHEVTKDTDWELENRPPLSIETESQSH